MSTKSIYGISGKDQILSLALQKLLFSRHFNRDVCNCHQINGFLFCYGTMNQSADFLSMLYSSHHYHHHGLFLLFSIGRALRSSPLQVGISQLLPSTSPENGYMISTPPGIIQSYSQLPEIHRVRKTGPTLAASVGLIRPPSSCCLAWISGHILSLGILSFLHFHPFLLGGLSFLLPPCPISKPLKLPLKLVPLQALATQTADSFHLDLPVLQSGVLLRLTPFSD